MSHRGSPLWIAGRIGILICFVVMPILRIRERVKWHKLHEIQAEQSEAIQRRDFKRFDELEVKANAEWFRITGKHWTNQ